MEMAINITAIDGIKDDNLPFFIEFFNFEHFKSKFLFSSFVLTLLLFLLSRTKHKLKRKQKKHKLPRVSWFPEKFSFLDGFYAPFKLRNDGVKLFEDMANEYGSIFEVPFGTITAIGVTDTLVIKTVLSSANPNHLNKPKYIYDKLFENVLGQGLIVADHSTWTVHRSVSNRAFSYRNFQAYLKIMNRHSKELAKKLHDKHAECLEGEVNIQAVNKLIDFHALGIVAETLYGPMYYSDDINENIQRNIHRAKEITLYRFMHPELFIECLWKLHPKKWELDQLWSKFSDALKEIVDTYNVCILKQGNQNVNLQSKFCSPVYGNNEDDIGEDNDRWIHVTGENDDTEVKPPRYMIEEMIRNRMSDEEIYSEIATFLIAGFETTVVSFNLLLFHLALNPDVQAKCQEEVDTLMNSKGMNRDSDLNIEFTMEDLTNLKYMERCIYENMRLTTPVPVYSRRLDTNLKVNEELEFEAGQVILLLPWVLHRDSRHFPSPLEFDPDRFLPENIKGRDPHAFIPLSGGPRSCIGRKFAIMMMKILLARVIRDFEIHTEDRFDDIKFFLEATVRPEREIKMSLKLRDEAHHAKINSRSQ